MNEDPKLILGACRPNGQDADDPVFAAARAAAEKDPQLAEWFRETQELDRAITRKLNDIEVPENLRAKILAGAFASRRKPWWQQRKLWAVAALLLVCASVAALWLPRASGLAPWQRHAFGVLESIEANRTKLDRETPEPEKLVAWLQEQSAPVLQNLPDSLAARRAFGCKTWEWRGLRLAMVCFDLGNSSSAHLVTTWHGGLQGGPPLGHMIYGRIGHWNTATWSEGGLACMLLTDVSEDEMQKLLASTGAPLDGLLLASLRGAGRP